jgi:ATP-binding cassette subfamily C (CFTR/MRP) protein 1
MTRAIDGNLPAWNHTGALRIANLGMRYRPGLPLVLKGIDIDIPAGSSVGIVGRTGAGKSSLFAAILRLVEPEAGSVVEIDGVDVASLGLHTLRRAISIIPQDPVLFNGSLRFNLDPLEMARDDGALWAALDKAGLGAHARGLPGQLDHAVLEGGKNFSQGEKQLVCLARALLRSSKLLLLDEATSSVDFETDAQIQATIRSEFGDATVLCIAHRVDTIRDCDQILVLSDGKVAEFGPPEELQARGGDYARLIEAHDAGFTDVADALLG